MSESYSDVVTTEERPCMTDYILFAFQILLFVLESTFSN